MEFTKIAVEAVVFIVLATVAATLTHVLVTRVLHRHVPRSAAVAVTAAVLVAVLVAEVWTQFFSPYRYAPVTLLICAAVAVLASAAQSRSAESTSQTLT